MLYVIFVKKLETKEVTSRGKITDDLMVQNNFLTAIAIAQCYTEHCTLQHVIRTARE